MMSRWGIENDDGWFIVYKDGVEVASSENGDRMADVLNDAFHDANARVAELEAAQRWIPVSERLPEGSGHYIVFDDHGDIMSCEFLADYKGEPLWDDDDGVLYWMPLPEPPEVE